VDTLGALALDQVDLLVVLGGQIGAYDDALYPFLSEEVDLIRQQLESGRPILGICLGAQLMARALGASVAPMSSKEIGYAPLQLAQRLERLREPVLGQHLAGLARQDAQQLELARGEVHGHVGHAAFAALNVQFERSETPERTRLLRGPSRHGANARDQLRHREGLDKKVVGTVFQAAQPLVERRARGDDDDRRRETFSPPLAQQRQAVTIGQAQVEHDDLGRARSSKALCIDGTTQPLDVESSGAQGPRQRGPRATSSSINKTCMRGALSVRRAVRLACAVLRSSSTHHLSQRSTR
jgi:GMP synthase-like glutamine amidotransferase